MRNWPAVLLLGLTLLPGPAQAQTYRWVDEDGTVHYSQGMDSIPERYRAQARPSVIAPTPSRPDLTEKPPPPSPARPPSPPPSPSEREPILEGERQGVLAVLLGVATVGVWALIVRRRRKRFSARAGDIQKPITPASRDQSLVPHPEMSGPAGGQRHLKCPQCSAHLTRLDPGGGIAVHWCQSCEGTWHDQGTLDEFTRESSLPELLQEKAVFSHPSDRRCPRCEVPMEKNGFGTEKFVVERCPSCQGLWLDHGEVAKLSHVAESEPPPMTCPRCQSALEARAMPEGVVADVCGHCWGAWYDKGELLFLARRVRDLTTLLNHPPRQGELSTARCPRCQDILEGGGLGPGKFRGDRCPKCEGIWLDAAEKAKLDEIIARCRPPVGRTPGTTDGLTVRFSRTKLILVVLGSLSLVVLATGAFLLDGGDWRETAWAVSLLGLIGFGLLYVLCRVSRRRLTLIVNREGIVDR